jgi:FkbM family methyltransferase
MNLLKPLSRPEYFFRPRQIVHRFKRALRRKPLGEFEMVTLPWGSQIRVRPEEVIGSNIWSYGVFDLMVTEALCRLLDRGETALDIGANIGQMSNLMRHLAGGKGQVISFEPHPEIFSELKYNLQSLPVPEGSARVDLHNCALSEAAGEAKLEFGPAWKVNRGTAKLATGASSSGQSVNVRLLPLDQVVDQATKVGVCKIDVEGHELQVFRGAKKLLTDRRIRDIVLEDHEPFPSSVHSHLIGQGFTLFSLHYALWRPRLVPASPQTRFDEGKEGKNYLATLDPERATARFRGAGWRCLS